MTKSSAELSKMTYNVISSLYRCRNRLKFKLGNITSKNLVTHIYLYKYLKVSIRSSPESVVYYSSVYENYIKYQFSPMSKARLLLLSSSNVHGYNFLEYATADIASFLNETKVSTVLFIPYAAIDYEPYLQKVSAVFNKWGYNVKGIHHSNPTEAVKNAEAIFVGGGNTFLLLKTLYDQNLIKIIHDRVFNDGVPYIGSSAGTNIAAPTVHNTNDMPIVYPPSFNALHLIPFNINPHYIDTDPKSTHKGETREERITQYHDLPDHYPVHNVLALREGSTLFVDGKTAVLKGITGARWFARGKTPQEFKVGTDISHLLTSSEFQEGDEALRI